jgi:hypothetical protein
MSPIMMQIVVIFPPKNRPVLPPPISCPVQELISLPGRSRLSRLVIFSITRSVAAVKNVKDFCMVLIFQKLNNQSLRPTGFATPDETQG